MSDTPWWRGAVIYEIYPRSFLDSNGDGVGDLPGIIRRLDYVASLGVDAIWIAPFFRSPMADFGYDVADYRSVDPLFGCMQDFDRLLEESHRRGLKVMIDQVLSHTSVEHHWFQESRSSRDNRKTDWYVWADPKPDGTPPNNWLSIFGGVAWQWEPRRRQYYLHNFLASQPDLNFHNPEVRLAVLDNVRFWLDKGVDGLRLDAINFCFHDAELRDNPAKPAELQTTAGACPDNPYTFQYHCYNNTRPENLAFLEELRVLLNRYPTAVSLGEICSENSLATMAAYVERRRLHMGYCFELLTQEFSAGHIRGTVERLERQLDGGWPCWAISNHDVQRVVSRWGGDNPPPQLANLLSALLCSLRGSVCIYQGEELGLAEADVPYAALRDPYGLAFWPAFKGRDGCRTPMPWTQEEHCGFSAVLPWLPTSPAHRSRCVELQERDAASTLNGFRAFLRWRKTQRALQYGAIEFLPTREPVLALVRKLPDSTLLAAFNLADQPVEAFVYDAPALRRLEVPGVLGGELQAGRCYLPAYGAVFAAVA
jgi:alpha-glucosidase